MMFKLKRFFPYDDSISVQNTKQIEFKARFLKHSIYNQSDIFMPKRISTTCTNAKGNNNNKKIAKQIAQFQFLVFIHNTNALNHER